MTVKAKQLTPLERPVAGMAVAFHDDEKAALLERVKAIADSGYFLWGDQQEELQKRFAKFVGREHALVFNSVTNAFELLLRYLVETAGIEEVVFQANAFPSMVFAARRVGLSIRFVDLDVNDGAMDYGALQDEALGEQTVVVLQHTGGVVGLMMEDLVEYARKAGAHVVEDASQGAGSTNVYGQIAGSFGDVALFSTSATKAFHTGQGGILVTDNAEIEEHMRYMRQYGRTQMFQAGEFVVEGTNANQSEMNAAVGNVMLDTLQSRIDYRKEIFHAFEDVLLENRDLLYCLSGTPNLYKVMCMPAQYDWDRPTMKAALKEAKLGLGSEVYEWLTPALPVFAGAFDDQLEKLEGGKLWASKHICLPMHNVMTPDDARAAAELIKAYLRG